MLKRPTQDRPKCNPLDHHRFPRRAIEINYFDFQNFNHGLIEVVQVSLPLQNIRPM